MAPSDNGKQASPERAKGPWKGPRPARATKAARADEPERQMTGRAFLPCPSSYPEVQMSGAIKPIAELVVPATGWSIAGPIEDENSNCETLWRAPLVAFLIQTFRRSIDETTFVGVTPVTANGDVSDMQEYAVQYGDRPPFFTVFEDFADEQELLAYFNQQRRAMMQATSLAKSRERAREAEISSDDASPMADDQGEAVGAARQSEG